MEPVTAKRLFDENSATYAGVNSIISLGMDRRWRAWVAAQAVPQAGATVLDAMSGTGEVAVAAAKRGGVVTSADISPLMLARATERARAQHVDIQTVLVDITDPARLRDPSLFTRPRFDAVCLSFGLRYADDPVSLLRGLAGLCAPAGRLVLLEFCRPPETLLGRAAGYYFFRVLPALAGRLGAGRELYDCLRDTTLAIGTASDIVAIVNQAGLDVFGHKTFGFGLVAGFVAKPR